MIYVVAVVMGYIITVNYFAGQQRIRLFTVKFAKYNFGVMSGWGGISFLLCAIPACILVGTANGNNIWDGVLFYAIMHLGGLIYNFLRDCPFNHLIKKYALPINIALLGTVYLTTRSGTLM